MDLLNTIMVAIISSATVTGLFVFIIKTYFEKRISHEFDKRNRLFDIQLKRLSQINDFMLDKELGIYPELSELVYRIRNTIKEGMTKDSPIQWSSALEPLCSLLRENMFKYKFFLDPKAFDELHEFKHLAQDFLLFLDIYTREDLVFDNEAYQAELAKLSRKYTQLDELFENITRFVQSKMHPSAPRHD